MLKAAAAELERAPLPVEDRDLSTTGTNLAGCTVSAEVRASDDLLNFPTFWTPVASGTSFCGAPPVFGR